MMTTMKLRAIVLGAAVLSALPWVAGCGRGRTSAAAAATDAAAALLPKALFGAVEGDPVDIVTARRSAVGGERLVVRGMVGGRVDPFVDRRAVMMLIDEALPICGHGCKTPWDMCCELPETVRDRSLSIQVVDSEGAPLHAALRGAGGLQPLARVVAAGAVRREGDAVILLADRLTVTAPGQAHGAACATCTH